MLTDLGEKIYKLLKKMPKGKVTTYKILAQKVGRPRNWRQIGNFLRENNYLKKYPCYKVVKSSGEIGGYRLGIKKKKKLLKREGVIINNNNKIQNFNRCLFKDF